MMKQCDVIGCTNEATHTWSGHLVCDECEKDTMYDHKYVNCEKCDAKFNTGYDRMIHERTCTEGTVGLHSPDEIETKKQAIDIATESFAMKYMEGYFERNPEEILYHAIENLNSLVVELKRG